MNAAILVLAVLCGFANIRNGFADHLEALWDVSLTATSHQDGDGIQLVFQHGAGGRPSVKIYAVAAKTTDTSDTAAASTTNSYSMGELTGSSCRSLGGIRLEDPPVGLIVDTNFSATESFVDISIDPLTVNTNPLIRFASADGGPVTLFCIYFSLTNEIGEDVSYEEIEARFTTSANGSIQLNPMKTDAASPWLTDLKISFGVSTSICEGGLPERQGDPVYICLSPNDSSLSLEGIEYFTFESGEITQKAVENNRPENDLTLISCNGGTCRFSTLLEARFFVGGPKTVTGYGVCNLQLADGRRLDADTMGSTKEASVEFRFIVGGSGEDHVDARFPILLFGAVLLLAYAAVATLVDRRKRLKEQRRFTPELKDYHVLV
jgi:hypothetical protein